MKDKILQYLKDHQNDYVSGEMLSEQFGVTRASIWKVMKALREEGYVIDSVSSKGYRLQSSVGVMNQEELEKLCRDNALWQTVYYFNQLSSTNDYAKEISASSDQQAALVVADVQTKGRGRLGREWSSPSKTGLWMSLLIKPRFDPSHAAKLTQLAALGVSLAIEKMTGLKNQIKWPNDIHINDKKVCGILTEMNAELGSIHYLIIGIGINVNTPGFDETLSDTATSLMLELGEEVDRRALLDAVIKEIEGLYLRFEKTLDLAFIQEELVKRSSIIGHTVRIQHMHEIVEANAVDIDQEGNLIVLKDGVPIKVFYGEVHRIRKVN